MISMPYRVIAVLLLAASCVAFGYVQGLARESDRRDAISLQQERDDHQAFVGALAHGQRYAADVITWQRKSQIYYQNWKRNLAHEKDTNLAQCEPSQAGVPTALLSATWVGMYNSAWLPSITAEDNPSGVAAKVATADPVTPREVLDNIAINAQRCGDDRKRHDALIDLLMKMGTR